LRVSSGGAINHAGGKNQGLGLHCWTRLEKKHCMKPKKKRNLDLKTALTQHLKGAAVGDGPKKGWPLVTEIAKKNLREKMLIRKI